VARRRRGGCLLRLLVLLLLGALLLFFVLDSMFNLRGNLAFLSERDSDQPLEIELAGGTWKPVAQVSIAELDHALRKEGEMENGASWRRLYVRRSVSGTWQRGVQDIFPPTVEVIEFPAQRYAFSVSFLENFALTTAQERLETENLTFAITANFRDPKGKPLGLVIHEGKQMNPPFPAWTGYFFVKDGRPWFGPKSLYEETPGITTEVSQGYPSLLKNHTIFPYVDLQRSRYFDGDKISYRALAGVRQNGAVVFIVSGNGGAMNVSEVATLAHQLNIQHATLLDGGRALQYSLKFGNTTHSFAAFNTRFEFPWKELAPQRSPVFIAVKPIASPSPAATPER
jgi:uncharacterized protein YigE (DUF2233 family)